MSTGTLWVVIALTSAVTLLIKGAGPAAMGDRQLPRRLSGVVALLAPALLAALVVTQALADGPALRIGADTAGVAAAGLLLWRGVSILPAVLAAVVVTASLRAMGVG